MKQKRLRKKVSWRYVAVLFVLFVQIGASSITGAIGPDEYSWQDVGIDTQSRYWVGLDGSNDGMKLIAIEGNALYRSVDGGASWSALPGMGGVQWRSVVVSGDGSTVIAAESGSNKLLRVSVDSGVTWTTRALPYVSSYQDDLMLSDAGDYLYVYDSLSLYVSTDLGQTWSVRYAFGGACPVAYVAASSSGMKLLLACYHGVTPGVPRISNDGGFNWADLNAMGTDSSWSNPVVSGDGTSLFVKKASVVHTSLDDGATWQVVPGVEAVNFVSSDGDVIFASIDDSSWDDPVRTTMSFDGGQNWQQSTVLDRSGDNWRYGNISDDKQLIALAPYTGSVTHSSDGGATWGADGFPLSTENEWSAVATSIDGKTVYAVNWWTAGSIQKSTDGGATWLPLLSAGFRYWDNVATSGDGRVVVAAQGYTWNSGYVHISHDGGETWTTTLNDAHRNWGEITLSDDGQDIIAANAHDTGGLFVSHDGGQTWDNRATVPTARFISVAMSRDGNKAVAVQYLSNGGGVYISNDGGDTWLLQASAGTHDWSSVACSSDCSKMIATDDGGYFYVSSDGGVTWQEHQEYGMKRWSSIAMSADGQRLALAEYWESSPVYLSDDGGQTWVQQTNTLGATDCWMDFALSADGTVLYGVAGTYGIASDTGRVYRAKLTSLVPPVVSSLDETGVSQSDRTVTGQGAVGSTVELTLPGGQVLSVVVGYSGVFSLAIPPDVQAGVTLLIAQRSAAGTLGASVSFVLGLAATTAQVLAPTGETEQRVLRSAGVLAGLSLASFCLVVIPRKIRYYRDR